VAAALLGPCIPAVFLVIHDSKDVELVWVEHPSDQAIAVVADIEHDTVANPIR
jgi:hypothetical protein